MKLRPLLITCILFLLILPALINHVNCTSNTLYAHAETTTLAGGNVYYTLKSSSADGPATTLSQSAASTGRKLMGRWIYPLNGIVSVSASTWTVTYRAKKSSYASYVYAHCDVDILIRKSDNTIRATIATNVANSPAISGSSWQTLTGTYNWPGYTVVSQTDYLEVAYYIQVTQSQSSKYVYFLFDDGTLPLADQTKVANVMFTYPNQDPVASFTYSPDYPIIYEDVTFNASASYDPDGSIVSYRWDFGDGNITTVTNPIITHMYTTAGSQVNYTVTLTVTDNGGATGSISQNVPVTNCGVLSVSLPAGAYRGSDPDIWLSQCWFINNTASSGTFTVRISDTVCGVPSYNTHLVIALDNAAYQYFVSLTVNSTTIPKSSFTSGTPKPYGFTFTWENDVYPTWFSDVYVVGNINPMSYKDVVVSATFSSANVRMHFDAYGSARCVPPTKKWDITYNSYQKDSTVVFCPPPVPQYSVTFTHTGLDSSATGVVVTVNGNPVTYSQLPYTISVNNGSVVTYSYNDIVMSTTDGKQFKLIGVDGPASPITVTSSVTVTGNYKIQYRVIFDKTGVGSDFTGTIVTVDMTNYDYSMLPHTFWWDKDSNHNFEFATPLVVNASKQYDWQSTSGLFSLRSGTLTVTTSGSVTGNYIVQNRITFDQTNVGTDFAGTIIIIDDVSYSSLPVSFMWPVNSVHSFAFQSPLLVDSGKKYVWNSTTGLSSSQSGNITVTTYGSIIGNYKTQYYMSVVASPNVTTPSGTGWYYANTYAPISTVQYAPGGSDYRYCFVGWITGDMPEIVDSSALSTTVLVDKSKTVTANYICQYLVTFSHTGLALDANGTVVTVNGTAKTYADLPYPMWVNESDVVYYSYESIVTSNMTGTHMTGTQFRLDSTTGPSSPITVTTGVTVTGNYVRQYYFNISSPYGAPDGEGWYDSGATAYASLDTGVVEYPENRTRQVFTHWSGDASGTNYTQSDPITMDGPKTAIANWQTQFRLKISTNGLGTKVTNVYNGTTILGNATDATPFIGWFDQNVPIDLDIDSPIYGISTKYVFTHWSGEAHGSSRPLSFTLNGPYDISANYKTQHQVTFTHSGLDNTATGTVVTVNGTSISYGSLPYQIWVDSGDLIPYFYSNVSSTTLGKRFTLIDVTGPTSPINVTIPVNVTGNYKTQYEITFAQTGLDSTATGTVVTVNGKTKDFTNLPYSDWFDSNSSVTYSYNDIVLSTVTGKRFKLVSVTGPASPINVTGPVTVTGNYKTQYKVTFDKTGVGSDFTGTVVTIDSVDYGVSGLPVPFWWDNCSSHDFSFASPLVVNVDKQYVWNSTSGLSNLQSDTLHITTCGSVTGNYIEQNRITFDKTGVGSDFAGVVVTIDGVDYTRAQLPISFAWEINSTHSFAFHSPLLVDSGKKYVWNSTSGLSSSQSNSTFTVTTYGSIIGNYKTQYYLILATNPLGIDTPTGAGWYYDDTYAHISTDALVDIVPGSSRYRFDGWTTADMSEITDPSASSTTVLMDKAKTVTAKYVVQYKITFDQTGVGTDFTGSVVNIDSVGYGVGSLPVSFWWDVNSVHNFDFKSPLVVTANAKRYVWTSTSGLSTLQTGSITVSTSGSTIGHYKTQYYLTVDTNAPTTIPGEGWYDNSTIVSLEAPYVAGYTFLTWIVDGTPKPGNPIEIHMNGPHTAMASYSGPPSVGGYSVSLAEPAETAPIVGYTMILAMFGVAITLVRRKRK